VLAKRLIAVVLRESAAGTEKMAEAKRSFFMVFLFQISLLFRPIRA
jgi:hypothetical protein